jgi:hypothetical protein
MAVDAALVVATVCGGMLAAVNCAVSTCASRAVEFFGGPATDMPERSAQMLPVGCFGRRRYLTGVRPIWCPIMSP